MTTATTPKSIHDYKAAIHALDSQGIPLQGVQHDPMLYSYLLDPTYSSHRLADVALRRFNLKLSGDLAEAADVTGRLATALREDVNQAGLTKLYEEMDLPLSSRASPHGACRSKNRHGRPGENVNGTRTRNCRQRKRNPSDRRRSDSMLALRASWEMFSSTSSICRSL